MHNPDAMFSIIIPVYNVAPYLKECLDSIINQTFKDFEVICVNDGSTDNSLEILNEYAQKDDRIKVYSQENQGSGVARNYGLDMAKGKYIAFVDPDDWIELNHLETLYNTFQKTGVEVIEFDFKTINDITKEIKYCTYGQQRKNLGCKKDLFKNPYFNWKDFSGSRRLDYRSAVWYRVYTHDFVKTNDLRFSPTWAAEDRLFSYGGLVTAEKIYYLNEYLYNYRQRQGSIVNTKLKRPSDIFTVIKSFEEFLTQKGLLDEFKEDFSYSKIYQVACSYKGVPDEQKESYLDRAKQELSADEYKKCMDMIKKKDKSFAEQVFSVKNRYENLVKTKVVTVLGHEFVF